MIYDDFWKNLFADIDRGCVCGFPTKKSVNKKVVQGEDGNLTATLEVVGHGKEDVSARVEDDIVYIKVAGNDNEIPLCNVEEYDPNTFRVEVKHGLLTFTASKKEDIKNEITLNIE